jgi:phospholipid/cholesterol/gamma-HCH transport system permease protein
MATVTVPSRGATLLRIRRAGKAASDQIQWLGGLVVFAGKIIVSVPSVLRRYFKEVLRLLTDVTFGGRLLAVTASTTAVLIILSAAVGIEIGVEGVQGLQVIGLAPLAGFLAAFGDTREIAPLITAFGIAAQLGCRFTAQIGAMRISEEIDALEVMGIPSLAYLITTRVIAALMAVIPLYLISLAGAYFCTEQAVSLFAHVGTGTYRYYFHSILTPRDVAFSTLKVVVFVVLITIIHTYYGYTAGGGPEGVGRATGRAIRASIVTLAVTDMLMTLLFWGTSPGIHITG